MSPFTAWKHATAIFVMQTLIFGLWFYLTGNPTFAWISTIATALVFTVAYSLISVADKSKLIMLTFSAALAGLSGVAVSTGKGLEAIIANGGPACLASFVAAFISSGYRNPAEPMPFALITHLPYGISPIIGGLALCVRHVRFGVRVVGVESETS